MVLLEIRIVASVWRSDLEHTMEFSPPVRQKHCKTVYGHPPREPIFRTIRHPAVQSKGRLLVGIAVAFDPPAKGQTAKCKVSGGMIGKSDLSQNTLAQLYAVSDPVERPLGKLDYPKERV